MNNTGRNSKNTGYLVALLLVVGLTAFSNSMKELAEIHRFTFDTGRLIAQTFVPAEIPQTPQAPLIVSRLESCESKAAPLVEVPSLEDVKVPEPAEELEIRTPQVKVEKRARIKHSGTQLAKLNKLRQFEFDATQFEFRVSSDENDEVSDSIPAPLSMTMTTFRAKNRKHNVIKLNPRDREMILKTLNRSINLRIAS